MPVLAVGGEKSFGATMAVVMRAAATNVVEGVVPDSGHWIMEENPAATIAMTPVFFRPRTVFPTDIEALPTTGASAGTAGVTGIQSRTLAGDPTAAGPYTIALNVPPNTSIQAHAHRDDPVTWSSCPAHGISAMARGLSARSRKPSVQAASTPSRRACRTTREPALNQ